MKSVRVKGSRVVGVRRLRCLGMVGVRSEEGEAVSMGL